MSVPRSITIDPLQALESYRGSKAQGINMSNLSSSMRESKPKQTTTLAVLSGVRINPGGPWVAPKSADNADRLAARLAKLEASEFTVTIYQLEKWSREFRFSALRAIHTSGVGVIAGVSGSIRRTVFDAVLEFVGPYDTVEEMTAIREAVCEAIALLEPAQHEEAINKARQNYKDAGLKPSKLSWFREVVQNLSASGNAAVVENDPQSLARKYLASLLEDADVSGDADVPRLRRRNGEWHRYNGQVYRTVTDEAVESDVIRMLQCTSTEIKIGWPLVRDVLLNLQALCALDDLPLNDSIFIDADAQAQVSPYVACQNGLLDLSPILAGESDLPVLYEFTPRHFSPVQLGFAFDPEAACPNYEKFIHEVLPAREAGDRRVERLEQFMGWALSQSALRLEKSAVLVGNGANGKTTELNLFTKLLGDENVSHVSLQDFGHRFRPAQMIGKLANISNDMSRVERFEEGMFKQIVSGDPVQFERKNRDPVSCYCHARLIFATNHLPAINDRTMGTFRRLLVIPFKESFNEAKADKLLDAKLAQELPGIANRLFRALASLVRAGHFAPCTVCAAAEATYQIDCDPFMQFFGEHCKLDELGAAKCSELYGHYAAYCRANGRHPVSSTEFAHRVEEKTGMKSKRAGTNGPRPRVLPGILYVDHVQRE